MFRIKLWFMWAETKRVEHWYHVWQIYDYFPQSLSQSGDIVQLLLSCPLQAELYMIEAEQLLGCNI